MSKFIEVHQVSPGIGRMVINIDYIIKVESSAHADGGTELIVKDGQVSYDSETGHQSYTVSFRVQESYQTIKNQLLDIIQGMKK